MKRNRHGKTQTLRAKIVVTEAEPGATQQKDENHGRLLTPGEAKQSVLPRRLPWDLLILS